MTRSFAHWSPRYIRDRIALEIWVRRNPDQPWLDPAAVALLNDLVLPTDRVFEWGSGRSTRWFAGRARSVTSIETRPEWHAKVEEDLAGYPNASCVLRPLSEAPTADEIDAYVSALESAGEGPFDLILVDGTLRDLCALRAIDLIAPGGVLIVDDVQRYLPSSSRSPESTTEFASEVWREFSDRVSNWRTIRTSSGVTDAGFWISP